MIVKVKYLKINENGALSKGQFLFSKHLISLLVINSMLLLLCGQKYIMVFKINTFPNTGHHKDITLLWLSTLKLDK